MTPGAEDGHRLPVQGSSRRAAWTARQQLARKALPMVLRGVALRPRMAHCEGLLLVGRGARLRNPQLISTGGRLVVEDFAEVQGLSRDGVHFGGEVSIGSFAMIRPSGYYSADIGVGLTVGSRSSIGPYCYIGCSGGITIGDDVMLAPGVRLFAEDHVFAVTSVTIKAQGVVWAPIVIEDDCWLASGVTVTSGVTIGRGSVVAAGSVVTSDIPPGSVAAGVPAKVLRSRT